MNNYKKVILTLVVAILGIGAANAQFRFGVKAGLNLNSFHLSDVKQNFLDSDNRCGWTAGVMTELQIPVIGLGFDLSAMYTRMASNVDETAVNPDFTEGGVSKNYFELPLNVKYKIGLPVVGNIITPYAFAGPTFAFRLGKNTLKEMKSHTCYTSLNVGIGVELMKHVQIQGSYGFALNRTALGILHLNTTTPETVKARNNYWTVTAAYLF